MAKAFCRRPSETLSAASMTQPTASRAAPGVCSSFQAVSMSAPWPPHSSCVRPSMGSLLRSSFLTLSRSAGVRPK